MNSNPFPNPLTGGKEVVLYLKNKDYFKIIKADASSKYKVNSIHKKNSYLYKSLMKNKFFLKLNNIKKKSSLNKRATMLQEILFSIFNDSNNISFESEDEILFDSESSQHDLLFGDSQVGGPLGVALASKYGIKPSNVVHKSGSTGCYWTGSAFGRIRPKLQKKPSKIIIVLGGNGPGCVKSLLNKIYDITPNSSVVFYTNGPVANYDSIDKKKYKINFGKELTSSLHSLYKRNRPRYKRSVKSQAESSLFANSNKIKIIDLFSVLEKDYNCSSSCDGIHLEKEEAEKVARH